MPINDISHPARSAAIWMLNQVIDVGSHTTIDPGNADNRSVNRPSPTIVDGTLNRSTITPGPPGSQRRNVT